MTADNLPVATLTFHVALDVTVRIHPIDDQLAEATKRRFNNPTLASDPRIEEEIARERDLLAAVLGDPESLRVEALRRVIWSLDDIDPVDGSLEDAKKQLDSDLHLVERLRVALPAEHYSFLRDVAEEDLFYDSTSFYQAAFAVEQSGVQIHELPEQEHAEADLRGSEH